MFSHWRLEPVKKKMSYVFRRIDTIAKETALILLPSEKGSSLKGNLASEVLQKTYFTNSSLKMGLFPVEANSYLSEKTWPFFAKQVSSFANAKTINIFFSKNISVYAILMPSFSHLCQWYIGESFQFN